MASKKKLLQAAAGSAGGAGLDVDEVFSTTVYDGTSGSSLSINNGIDLSGEGGLVWTKERSSGGGGHILFSTDASGNHSGLLVSSSTAAAGTGYQPTYFTFNNNGYTTTNTVGDSKVNGNDYVSWTFRKAKKFFDVVKYTGNGVSGTTISHNLGSVPGMIIIKCTNQSENWLVYHRSSNANPEDYWLKLNGTNAASSSAYWGNALPTSTEFTIGGNAGPINQTTGTYIAYLFAHNDGDGEFGPDSDADIIKCGSYTGNGSTNGPEIDLGFEPQFVIIKRSTGTEDWLMFDSMRGMVVGGIDRDLRPNQSQVEGAFLNYLEPNATGFKLINVNNRTNGNGDTYIYTAIRRGPLAAPDDATKVFHVSGAANNNVIPTGFNVDMNINTTTNSQSTYVLSRLLGRYYHQTNGNNALADGGSSVKYFDTLSNHINLKESWWSTNADLISWSWKRAPEYFDVVCYKGTGSNRTISHNLGAVPEMMWVKGRDVVDHWHVYHKDSTADNYLVLNETLANVDSVTVWNDTTPTSSVFTVGTNGGVNGSGDKYIAYLFATVAGVSKVGSYSGNGGSQNIDCGFSSGARFVLIKRTDQSEGWKIHDSVRGIVAGNDPFLELNNTNAENSSFDLVDPYSGGFAVNNYAGWNASGGSYIFYAIA